MNNQIRVENQNANINTMKNISFNKFLIFIFFKNFSFINLNYFMEKII
jgi:hypothetical protein